MTSAVNSIFWNFPVLIKDLAACYGRSRTLGAMPELVRMCRAPYVKRAIRRLMAAEAQSAVNAPGVSREPNEP